MASLGDNLYGKARVRVMKVERHETHHAMREWNVCVLLHGDFESCFTAGDNSSILPTDTMKNTVYYLARKSHAATPEEFATELVEYLLANNPQVSKASAEIEEKSWERAVIDGAPHATTYRLAGPELQIAEAVCERGGELKITSGIDGLVILKTTRSAFTGYIKDKLTTLPESTDRIFGTRATAAWEYATLPQDFAAARATALAALLRAFADHDSLSVQHTLFYVGKAMLAAVPQMVRVKLTMPNLHCNLVDLSRFGLDNPNQVYVPIDEPHGYIEAVIER